MVIKDRNATILSFLLIIYANYANCAKGGKGKEEKSEGNKLKPKCNLRMDYWDKGRPANFGILPIFIFVNFTFYLDFIFIRAMLQKNCFLNI